MPRTDDEWADIARWVRHAANKVGPALPLCLPGEPQECGRNAQQHVQLWSSDLKARAHHLIEDSALSREEAAYSAGPMYKEKLSALRERAARQ
ncbi:hypothetical protein PUR28_08690 [Streptomyces sp. BE308]|uniref:hypothetical protein n=1 Tax=Streptomyces sp. BE308 TaxID=3002529 RepID=UPI002E75EA53|nr:hypothetical protein [Streptomyces sp. BE308]MEE1790842.1 hypothetical protein [Streptomyces sp. BE308]